MISLYRISLHWSRIQHLPSWTWSNHAPCLADIASLLIVRAAWSASSAQFVYFLPLSLLSLVLPYSLSLSSGAQPTTFPIFLSVLFSALSSASLLLLLHCPALVQRTTLLLSQLVIASSVAGLMLSSFSLSFPLLYAHLSLLCILISPAPHITAFLVFSLGLLLSLAAFSTLSLLPSRGVSQPFRSSESNPMIDHSFLALLSLWVAQCVSLSRLFFFISGHRYDFSALQLSVAFIGIESFSFAYGACLVAFNTFAFDILVYAALLTFLTFLPSSDSSSSSALSAHLLSLMTTFRSLILWGSVLSSYFLRRHLMVWAIFAPKVSQLANRMSTAELTVHLRWSLRLPLSC
jgi:hypothetical protein